MVASQLYSCQNIKLCILNVQLLCQLNLYESNT
jgi:hypothetical protein